MRNRGAWIAGLLLMAAAGVAAGAETRAHDLVNAVVTRLEKMESLRFRAQIEYEAVQPGGSKVEFGSVRTITLKRPDRMRIDAELRDGHRMQIYYDGKYIIAYSLDESVYAVHEVGGSVDEAIEALEGPLGVPMPLGDLTRRDLRTTLVDETRSSSYVGIEKVDGVICHHVALQAREADLQLWITRSEEPVIRRIVITYVNEPGLPQFRADLLNWDFEPETPESLFRFNPPEDSERVPFVEPDPATQVEE